MLVDVNKTGLDSSEKFCNVDFCKVSVNLMGAKSTEVGHFPVSAVTLFTFGNISRYQVRINAL